MRNTGDKLGVGSEEQLGVASLSNRWALLTRNSEDCSQLYSYLDPRWLTTIITAQHSDMSSPTRGIE